MRRYLDANGNAAMRVDGYSEARWTYDESRVRRVAFYDLNGSAVSAEGLNLVLDMPSGQSAWHAPQRDMKDRYYKIATVNLDEGTEGDTYTIQLEIEFSNVAVTEGKSFLFLSQGAVDGSWSSWRERNIWNSRVVRLEDAPEDGVYTFTLSQTITEQQAGAETFDLGFRCDNWAAGAFRVRRLKVEKGDSATAWTPGI